MKKYILLNLTGLFVFFLFTCMFISCGKSGKSNPESEESSKPPTTSVGPKATKFTPQMVVAAIEYMAEKLPEEDREDFLDDSPLKDLHRITDKLNRDVAEGEIKVSEISGKALGEALYQKMFGSDRGGLGKARAKANRIKCVNNLGQVFKSMLSFAQDNGERLPWQLTPSGVRNHLDAAANASVTYGKQNDPSVNLVNHHPKAATVGGVFGILAVKRELQTPKILISPCDPGRKAANEVIQKNWKVYDTKLGKLVPHNGLSYGLCFGADTQRPSAVLGTTRNLSTGDLATAKWLGAEDKLRGMLGLKINQGQKVHMDGSAHHASDKDIGEDGRSMQLARRATGGVAVGKTSTKMMLPYDTE